MRTRVIPLAGLLVITGLLTLFDGGKGRSQQPVPDFLQKIPAPAGRPADDGSALVREFLVTPQVGPWMILVASYVGPEAYQMARDFVLVLRDPAGPYKMNAYVFNRGADERQKEQQRVEQYKQQIREKHKQMGMEMPTKIWVKRMKIEDQCAVLVGGFKDMKTARAYLDVIKKFETPDPRKVKMDSASVIEMDQKGKATKAAGAWINPFKHSFVVPNPTAPPAANQNLVADPFLKTLNANESYSLLKCPRPYTLLVKQFQGAAVVQQEGGGILGKVGKGTSGMNGATLDAAGQSAHNLAELLANPKLGLQEVYVLHTRYNSSVTVGSFADEKDPQLQRTLQMWAHLQQQIPPDRFAQLQLLAQPIPFVIPRPK